MNYFRIFIFIFLLPLISCGGKNRIEEINEDFAKIKKLPTNIYGYRRGSTYIEDIKNKKFRLWFQLDVLGNVDRIFAIDNFQNREDSLAVISLYKIDTVQEKKNMQQFINLSRKYGFGHICMDTIEKCYLSTVEGLAEEYVKTFNDSIYNDYRGNKNFKLLENGWFENIDK